MKDVDPESKSRIYIVQLWEVKTMIRQDSEASKTK